MKVDVLVVVKYLGDLYAESGQTYKARSRLYRSQIFQVNTRWKALSETVLVESVWVKKYTKINIEKMIRSLSSIFCSKIAKMFAIFFCKSLLNLTKFRRNFVRKSEKQKMEMKKEN